MARKICWSVPFFLAFLAASIPALAKRASDVPLESRGYQGRASEFVGAAVFELSDTKTEVQKSCVVSYLPAVHSGTSGQNLLNAGLACKPGDLSHFQQFRGQGQGIETRPRVAGAVALAAPVLCMAGGIFLDLAINTDQGRRQVAVVASAVGISTGAVLSIAAKAQAMLSGIEVRGGRRLMSGKVGVFDVLKGGVGACLFFIGVGASARTNVTLLAKFFRVGEHNVQPR